jgi:inhibitor of KinA
MCGLINTFKRYPRLDQQPDIFPLGDGALTIDLGNRISQPLNDKVMAMHQWFRQQPFDGLLDLITAYSSLTIVYDTFTIKTVQQPGGTVFDWVKEQALKAWTQAGPDITGTRVQHRIPVCYGPPFAPDLEAMARQKQLGPAEIISLHTGRIYRVYMIGFLPGFSYMAEVDQRIAHPRKEKPVSVQAGSIGIAGSQTGIYPLTSPGGWNIIGRTPIKMFNPSSKYPVPLKAGDEVEFYSIPASEWPS